MKMPPTVSKLRGAKYFQLHYICADSSFQSTLPLPSDVAEASSYFESSVHVIRQTIFEEILQGIVNRWQ
jgi:hypothetical protein